MRYAVTGKYCFDGRKVINDFSFIVENGCIQLIGSKKDINIEGLEIIDAQERLVTPGLIDAHVHVCADPYNFGFHEDKIEMTLTIEKNLKTLLQNGIVYIRDVGAPTQMMKTVKKMVAEGGMIGPDLKIAGQAICATGGHGWQISREANCKEDVCRFVRENIRDGVDVIKLMVTGGINTPGDELAPLEMTEEEIRKGVEEAHRRGRKVAVHTHGRSGIAISLKCGVDSIEHGLLMDKELAEIAALKGTCLVPTLSAPYFATVQGLKKEPESISFLKSKEVMEQHRKNVKVAYDLGVKLAMGSDSGTPFNGFDTVLEELILLREIGIPEEEVFRMATSYAASLIEVDKTHGTLEVGKKASFLIFDKNPIQDIHTIYDIHAVYKDGEKIVI